MSILRLLLALFFLLAGAWHFVSPQAYIQIMPPYLPWPLWLIYISGIGEMVGGAGLLLARLRRFAGYGLIALLVAVFPANIHMAVNHISVAGLHLPAWLLWLRLPLQFVFILWVWACALREPTDRRASLRVVKT